MMTRMLSTLALLVVLAAAPAAAQRENIRDGFWIGFGLGYGSLGFSCDGCEDFDREAGLTGHFRLGGTVRPHLLVGAEINAWAKEEAGATLSVSNVSGTVSWYPQETGAFFLKGGIGYSVIAIDTDFGDADEGGFGFLLGAGYDVRLSRNFSLTPLVNYTRGAFDGADTGVLELGLGATFH